MWGALQNLFRVNTIRTKIFVTLGLLFVARVGRQVPLPGVDRAKFQDFVGKASDTGVSEIMGLMNALSGGNFQAPVLFALGILPYITSSIVFSLLVKVLPSLEALSKEGASGQKKINQYSRMLTVPICIVQGTALCYASFNQLGGEGSGIITDFGVLSFVVPAVLGMTAGTIFMMWLGEQITAHGVGNGVSLLIVAGIVADLPKAFLTMFTQAQVDRTLILKAAVLMLVYFGMVVGIVYMTKGQRRIPIQQAKLMKGRKMFGGARHYLPIKLNMANVMPVIFANALLMLPITIMTWVSKDRGDFLSYGGWWYVTIFSALIMFFAFFWTSLMFQPSEMANNLKEYGSFIPGIRPGKKTAEFLESVLVRITLVGAVCLTLVAVIPLKVSDALDVNYIVASFMGGTGILIVVGVTLDLVDQLNASLLQRDYEGFMSASSSKRGSRR